MLTRCLLQAALRNYQAKRGKLPKNIFLYRDGVSEGEYWKVDDEEIKKIEGMPSTNWVSCRY